MSFFPLYLEFFIHSAATVMMVQLTMISTDGTMMLRNMVSLVIKASHGIDGLDLSISGVRE